MCARTVLQQWCLLTCMQCSAGGSDPAHTCHRRPFAILHKTHCMSVCAVRLTLKRGPACSTTHTQVCCLHPSHPKRAQWAPVLCSTTQSSSGVHCTVAIYVPYSHSSDGHSLVRINVETHPLIGGVAVIAGGDGFIAAQFMGGCKDETATE